MSKRKAGESRASDEANGTDFDEGTIGDAAAFLRDVDDDDFLGRLLSAKDGEHVGADRDIRRGCDGLTRNFEPIFCAGGPVGAVSDLLDPLEQNFDSKAPGKPMCSELLAIRTRYQQLNPIAPRGSIGNEGAPYQPVAKTKRGPYREKRESWTTTTERPGKRMSGTISTKSRSNPLPFFREREVYVSATKKGKEAAEEQEAETEKIGIGH